MNKFEWFWRCLGKTKESYWNRRRVKSKRIKFEFIRGKKRKTFGFLIKTRWRNERKIWQREIENYSLKWKSKLKKFRWKVKCWIRIKRKFDTKNVQSSVGKVKKKRIRLKRFWWVKEIGRPFGKWIWRMSWTTSTLNWY